MAVLLRGLLRYGGQGWFTAWADGLRGALISVDYLRELSTKD